MSRIRGDITHKVYYTIHAVLQIPRPEKSKNIDFVSAASPLIWLAMVGPDLTARMLIGHFFTFDPEWIRSPRSSEHIFFVMATTAKIAAFDDSSKEAISNSSQWDIGPQLMRK
jgi:hypothetical protein